jgi:hypothetical protein
MTESTNEDYTDAARPEVITNRRVPGEMSSIYGGHFSAVSDGGERFWRCCVLTLEGVHHESDCLVSSDRSRPVGG